MDLFDGINVTRRRSHLHKEPKQQLGAGFQFSEDADSLHSILSNKGISQAQRNQMHKDALGQQQLGGGGGGQEEKYEFFQGHGGHMFFRRKVVATSSNRMAADKNMEGSTTASNFTSTSINKKMAPSKDMKEMPIRFGSGKKLHNFAISARKENEDPNSMSEKKKKSGCVEMFVAPHRQSISEKKPIRRRSELPKPSNFGGARKGLNFEKGKEVFKKPFTPCTDKAVSRGEPGAKFPLEPLRRLDRDSMKLLPRDSLAWIAHLPRDSATFLELERLMHDKDKDLLREDDTGSFEAMELRLKTPRKINREQESEEKDNKSPVTEESEESSQDDNIDRVQPENDAANENEDNENVNDEDESEVTPIKTRHKVMLTLTPKFTKEEISECDTSDVFVPKADFIQGDLLDDLQNMPMNAQLATPTIKSQSMSDIHAESEPKEVHRSVSDEMLGGKLEEVSSLVSLDNLHRALREMEEMRREQEDLARKQEELFARIRERKQSFKALWGVSPMSVNKTRTVINKQTKNPPTPVLQNAPKDSVPEDMNEHSDEDSTVEMTDMITSINVPETGFGTSLRTGCSLVDTPNLTGLRPLPETPGLQKSILSEVNSATPEAKLDPSTTTLLNTEMKRVRFNSGENKAKIMTPDPEVIFQPRPKSEEAVKKCWKEKDENLSKYSRRSLNSQSFVSLKSSFSFLQTPGAGGTKSHSVLPVLLESSKSSTNTDEAAKLGLPTPMALKSLSARVKEEYAMLYADDEEEGEGESEEEGEEEEEMEGHGHGYIMKRLKF